jgi:hypothetical protein
MVVASALWATTHGIVLLASGLGQAVEGLEILAITVVVAGPILILLASPGTAVLFSPSTSPRCRSMPERRWWTLSLQWFAAALSVALAFGLVRLLSVGPLVEVVWAGVLMTGPGR